MRDRLVGRAHTEEEKKKKNTVLRPVKSTLADVESMKEVRKRKKKNVWQCLCQRGRRRPRRRLAGAKTIPKEIAP